LQDNTAVTEHGQNALLVTSLGLTIAASAHHPVVEFGSSSNVQSAVAELPSCLRCRFAAGSAYLCNIITIWVYQAVPLLSALGVQPVAFSPAFRYVSMHIHLPALLQVRPLLLQLLYAYSLM
jgi:hypothetical protein